MDAEELLRMYAAGERDFTGVKLSKVRLVEKQLRGAIFREADFSDANLEGTIFTEADLNYANLKGALLQEAVFQESRFSFN